MRFACFGAFCYVIRDMIFDPHLVRESYWTPLRTSISGTYRVKNKNVAISARSVRNRNMEQVVMASVSKRVKADFWRV